jgi:ABC-2 type transport system permease protein
MTAAALAWHQFSFDVRVFWRSPASVFFTVLLPLIFLFIFTGLFGSETIEEYGGIKVSTYYVPGIITLAVASATLQSLAINLTEARESGRLKRIRSTPLPVWAFVAGRVGNAFVISVLMVVLVTLIGHFFFDVAIPTTTIPALLVTLVVGAFAFSCLGFALTAAIPSQEAAPPIANVVLLPLYFLSGVFIPDNQIPDGVLHVADVFPIRHFFLAFFEGFDPNTTGAGFEWGHLAVLACWGLIGLALAARYFRWAPRR